MNKAESERHFFDNIANSDEYDLFPEDFYERVISHTIRNLGLKSIIIDIGSGSGAWGGRLAKKGYFVAGTDISRGMLLNSRKLFNNDFFAVCCDSSNLPFKEGVADCVFYGFSLHHMPDTLATLKEARTCLKPNGLLVLVEPNGSNPIRRIGNLLGKALNRTKLYSFSSPVERSLDIHAVYKLLKVCAFTSITLSVDTTLIKDSKSSVIVKTRDCLLYLLAKWRPSPSTAINFVVVTKR